MKIYYIHHSSFIVETDNSYLIFDYFKAQESSNSDFNFKELLNNILESEKQTYVFSSHSHHDHYNSEILSWRKRKENIHYILSYDIKLFEKIENSYIVKENETLIINDIKIKTFGSTDEGVSFLIYTDNQNIFHAGDLNWWKWMDDSEEEAKSMENKFKNIVDSIAKSAKVDIAFFPVDRRLEENYKAGGLYFIEKIAPKIFIPMHFWDDFKVCKDFKELIEDKNIIVLEIKHPNEILK